MMIGAFFFYSEVPVIAAIEISDAAQNTKSRVNRVKDRLGFRFRIPQFTYKINLEQECEDKVDHDFQNMYQKIVNIDKKWPMCSIV